VEDTPLTLWRDVLGWYARQPQWRVTLTALLDALVHANRELPLTAATTQALYGASLRGSVSRLENFRACPFRHFATYGLQLQERAVFRLATPDIGQLYHAALAKLVQETGDKLGTLTEAELTQAVNEVMAGLSPRLQSQILLRSQRHQYLARTLRDIVLSSAQVLAEHARRAEFRPHDLELSFGNPQDALPPLVVPLSDGRRLEMSGRIDRVDVAEADGVSWLRIIDYKSSAHTLPLDQVVHGLKLQLVTYMDALLTIGERWLGTPVKPAGAFYFHVHNPLLSVANPISPDQVAEERHKGYKLRGLLLENEAVLKQMDSEFSGGSSELIQVGTLKDGSFKKNADVASEQQWNQLRRHVRDTLKELGDRIYEGDIAIKPYRQGNNSACTFCLFSAVCQFDQQMEENAYERVTSMKKDEVWCQLDAEERTADTVLMGGERE
jgi:ATP-dependent helicase/nuclease subunit B